MRIDPPESSKAAELAVATVKGAISAVPVVGGLAAEIGSLYFDPLKRRNEKWIATVSEALSELYSRTDCLPENLAKDERFLSLLYQATSTAWKNHQDEKLRTLKSALVSAGTNPIISDDTCFRYFRLVDELTVSHIKLLSGIFRHADELSACKDLSSLYERFSGLVASHFTRMDFRALIEDLDRRFLIRRGDLGDYPEFESGAEYIATERSLINGIQVTTYGREFLLFIEEK